MERKCRDCRDLAWSDPSAAGRIEVRVADETVWLTQKLISVLFDKGRSTITEHLKNIFDTGELDGKAVCRDFRQTAGDGQYSEFPNSSSGRPLGIT